MGSGRLRVDPRLHEACDWIWLRAALIGGHLGRADGWGVGVGDVLVLLDCVQQKQQKGGWFAFRREVEVVAMFEWRASSFEDDE